MPIFKNTVHVGIKEVLMGTDDYNDKSVTFTKLSDEVTTYLSTLEETGNSAIDRVEAVEKNTENAIKAANEAADSANIAACNAADVATHPTEIGENGNWWKWNFETHTYEDTGVIAKGGALYPTFVHNGNKLYLVDCPSQLEGKFGKNGNKLTLDIVI